MIQALPIELLKRMAEALPAVYAAIRFILGMALEPEEIKLAKDALRAKLAEAPVHGAGSAGRVGLPPFTLLEKGRAVVPEVVHLGRLRYRPGFNRVRIGKKIFDLRNRQQAQICLEFMIRQHACDAGAALHFLTEIDPEVRRVGNLGDRGQFSEPKIDQYFNDPQNLLPQLRAELIAVVRGIGQYFLKAAKGPVVEFDYI